MSEKIVNAHVYTMPSDRYDNTKRAAKEVGLRARQHGQSGADVEMDTRWKATGPTGTPGDVETRENMENQRAVEVSQKIAEIIGQDPESMARKRRQDDIALYKLLEQTGMGDAMDMNIDPFEMGQMRAAQQARAPLREEESAPKGMWKLESLQAKTKSGKTIPVWQVKDGRTGTTIPHPFRLMETAERVQMALNRTGNLNDPRVTQWIDVDKRRASLVNKARQLKEAVQAGNKQARVSLTEVKEEILRLDAKIGL